MKILPYILLLILWGVIFHSLEKSLGTLWVIVGFVVAALIILFVYCAIALLKDDIKKFTDTL